MATPTSANNTTPLSNAGKGANHQRVTAALPNFTPSHYNPVPVAANLAGGATGTAYSETINAQGGTSPYTFAVTSGALPTGTTLNPSSGVISGTPSAASTFSFTITVTDSLGLTGSQAFQIIIAAPSAGGGGSFTFLA
jgi:large repetitive protein